MYSIKSPRILSKLSKKSLFWEITTSEKDIYLTFDDGPIPEVTPKVLDILNEYKIQATFFCVGENVKNNPDIYISILDNNHSVGNHTYNHLNGWKTLSKNYYSNIEKCSELVKSNLFRPPHGMIKPSQIIKLKKEFSIILWSVLTGDFDHSITPQKCLENAIDNTTNGSIVVFHDSIKSKKNMLYALPKFIEHFLNQGYYFKKLNNEY